MRTTLTLDDALFKELKKLAHRDGVSLELVVNRAIRMGLQQLEKAPRRRSYRITTFAMGVPRVPSLDKALSIAAALEDEEVARQLLLGK